MAGSALPSNRYTSVRAGWRTVCSVLGFGFFCGDALAPCNDASAPRADVSRSRTSGDRALDLGWFALEHYAELRTHAWFALYAHASAHGFDHVLHDRQAEPSATNVPRTACIHAIKAFEKA